MTTPRFALLAALSLALAAPLVPALTVRTLAQVPRMNGNPQAQNMANALGLTPAQQKQVTAVGMKAGRQMQALQANPSLTPAARMAKMRGIQQSVRGQMMAILTPAQRTKLMTMVQARRQGQMGGRR